MDIVEYQIEAEREATRRLEELKYKNQPRLRRGFSFKQKRKIKNGCHKKTTTIAHIMLRQTPQVGNSVLLSPYR